jgi:PhnB protein
MSVKPIPNGYQTVIPYLLVEGAAELITFLTTAFDAKVRQRLDRPNGSIMHVELQIGDSVVMLGEPMAEFGPMPSSIYLYVEDCDAIYNRALQAGAASVMQPTDMPHAGERYGGVRDASGNLWWIATHIEDVSPEEQARRVKALTMEEVEALAKQ